MELMLNVTYTYNSAFEFDTFSRALWTQVPAPGEVTELMRPDGTEGYIGILSDPEEANDQIVEFVAALSELPGIESVEAEWAVDVEPYMFTVEDCAVASRP